MNKLLILCMLGMPAALAPAAEISNVVANGATHSTIRIYFDAGTPTMARIQYGPTTRYGYNTNVLRGWSSTPLITTNAWFLSGLSPNTTYHFCPQVSTDGVTWEPPCDGTNDYTASTTADVAPHPAEPALPTIYKPSYPVIDGTTYTVDTDCSNLQMLLNTAAAQNDNLNHQIVIPVGAVCAGAFNFPARAGTGWIVVRSAGVGSTRLPPSGVRVDPAWTGGMATIRNNSLDVVFGAPTGSCSTGPTRAFLGEYRWNPNGSSLDLYQCVPDAIFPITDVTGRGVTPVTLTVPGHPLTAPYSDTFDVFGVEGNTVVNYNGWRAGSISGDEITLDIPLTPNGDYVGGGVLRVNTWERVRFTQGTSNPDTCTPGEWFFRTDLAASEGRDKAAFWCTATNTWSRMWMRYDMSAYAIQFDSGAHHYWLRGLEIDHTPFPDLYATNAVSPRALTGGWWKSWLVSSHYDETPHDLVIEQCYLHGQGYPGRLGTVFRMQGGTGTMVKDSYIDKVNVWTKNSYGEWISNFLNCRGHCNSMSLINNYIDAVGIAVHQTDETIVQRSEPPTDWYVYRNRFHIPDRYMATSPETDGRFYFVRHQLEFKRGRRILVDGNIFEGTFVVVNQGALVALTPRPGMYGGQAPQDNGLDISDVTFTNNTFRRAPQVLVVIGHHDNAGNSNIQLMPLQRMKWRNNLIYDIDGSTRTMPGRSGGGAFMDLTLGIEDVQVVHNTVYNLVGNYPRVYGPAADTPNEGLVWKDNFFPYADMAIGHPTQNGRPALDATVTRLPNPNWTFANNVWINRSTPPTNPVYPSGNFYTASPATAGFANYAARDFRLTSGGFRSGQANAASDAKDIGANIDELESAQGVLRAGNPSVGSTQALIPFTAPDAAGCAVDVSADNFNTTIRVADPGGLRNRSVRVEGLSSDQVYAYRILCAAQKSTGVFATRHPGGDLNLPMQFKPAVTVAEKVVVEHGSTEALGASVGPVNCAAGCTVNVPATLANWLFYRFRYQTNSGADCAAGPILPILP